MLALAEVQAVQAVRRYATPPVAPRGARMRKGGGSGGAGARCRKGRLHGTAVGTVVPSVGNFVRSLRMHASSPGRGLPGVASMRFRSAGGLYGTGVVRLAFHG